MYEDVKTVCREPDTCTASQMVRSFVAVAVAVAVSVAVAVAAAAAAAGVVVVVVTLLRFAVFFSTLDFLVSINLG